MRARIVAVSGDADAQTDDGMDILPPWDVTLVVTAIDEHVTKEVVLRAMRAGVEFLVVPQ